jgi:hypothetical protein
VRSQRVFEKQRAHQDSLRLYEARLLHVSRVRQCTYYGLLYFSKSRAGRLNECTPNMVRFILQANVNVARKAVCKIGLVRTIDMSLGDIATAPDYIRPCFTFARYGTLGLQAKTTRRKGSKKGCGDQRRLGVCVHPEWFCVW